MKKEKEKIVNVPNAITLTRLILMIPTIAFTLIGNLPTAGGFYIAAAATDGIDGWYARKFNKVTKFGAKFDAVTDKAIMLGVLPMVISNAPFLLINLFIFELPIAALNLYSKVVKGNDPKTVEIGRKKTIALCALIASGYFIGSMGSLNSVIQNLSTLILFPITVILQSKSIKEYLNIYIKTENQKLSNKITPPNFENIQLINDFKLENEKQLKLNEPTTENDFYKDHPLHSIPNDTKNKIRVKNKKIN